ncbi:hypothetical protein GINT2_001746 [Glugoides intestinalis]
MNKNEEIIEFAFMLLQNEMYWSALLLGEYILEEKQPAGYYLVIKALYHLNFMKKLQSIVENNPELLKYQEIKLLYIKSGKETEENATLRIILPEHDMLNPESVELLFSAFSKKETHRKRAFMSSFENDTRNIEGLLYLYKESLCTKIETFNLITRVPMKSVQEILYRLVSGNIKKDNIECPLQVFSMVFSFLYQKGYEEDISYLFRTCVKHIDHFSDCEFIYMGIGMYYLSKNQPKEALKSFYKAIELNKNLGTGYLFAGIAHSRLKETEYAVKLLDNAYSIMESFYVPSYCLAYEYQLMNNIPKAKHYFKRCLELMEGDQTIKELSNKQQLGKRYRKTQEADFKVLYSFIYCLIYNEEYDEAMNYIKQFEVKNVLKVFCLLFSGMIEEAKNALEDCAKDGLYYACKGFINHLVDDFENAIKNYEKSLESGANAIIENLLVLAYENQEKTRENRAFDYSNCLFESLGFRNKLYW